MCQVTLATKIVKPPPIRKGDSRIGVMPMPPALMGTKDICQELESLGIGAKAFVEKRDLIDALVNARKQGDVRGLARKDSHPECETSATSRHVTKHTSTKKSTSGDGRAGVGGHGATAHGVPPSQSQSRSRTTSVGRSISRPALRERIVDNDGEGKLGREISTAAPVKIHSLSKPRSSSTTRRTRDARSKSRDPKPRARRVYDTPFDHNGRCHYHRNVQLATKKMTGGWAVVHSTCPKCMEEADGGIIDGDGASENKASRVADAHGQYDKNGCCVRHTHIQVAKKKMLGGFKVVRTCPACNGDDVGLDDISVSSKKSSKSTRSSSSRKTSTSTSHTTRGSGGKSGKGTSSGRYGRLPFDADGYCCRHPAVQLAKKKVMGGGFKIIHNICPHCSLEDDRNNSEDDRSRRSQRSGRRK